MRTPVWLRGLVVLLGVLNLTLTHLAYASPLDPTWVPGLWDDDDFDEVVEYITSAPGLVDEPVVRRLRPLPVLVLLELQPRDEPVSFVPPPAADPRAPPSV